MTGIQDYLLLGLFCMLGVGLLRRKQYKMYVWQVVVSMIFLLIVGVLGTLLLFYIENGKWGGTSFYGSIFLIPIIFVLVTSILKVPYGKIMDFCAAPICAMLAVMKCRCIQAGCCGGRLLSFSGNIKIRFPSRIAELIVILIIMCVLIYLERREKYANKIYSIFLVLYGVTRFLLNFGRTGLTPFIWILPPGHFWSIVAVVIGGGVLLYKGGKKIDDR